MHQTRASVFAVLACLAGMAPMRAAEEGALRLAAAFEGETLTQFAVDKRQIVSRDGATSLPVPDSAVWTLTGDLRAHADLFLFSPEYEIVNRLSTAEADAGALLRYAIVRPRRRSFWTDDEVKGSVVVFVWLVDRKPVAVVPVPSFNKGGVAGDFAAIATIPLTASTTHGAPAVLLWKDGRFIQSRPWFSDRAANATMAAVHLAWGDEARTVLGKIRNPNVRIEGRDKLTETRSAIRMLAEMTNGDIPSPDAHKAPPPPPSLLQFAAAGGFTDVVSNLLELGARADLDDPDAWGPIHAAAENGRYEAIRLLLTHYESAEQRPRWRVSPVGVALSNGHAAAASALISGPSDPAFSDVVRMAVAFGDETAIRDLLSKGAESALASLPVGMLARLVQRGEAEVVQALLDAGMPAHTAAGGTPILILGAASGKVDCVNVLLGAHAPTDDRADGGITSLMTAANGGYAAVVDALLAAGAEVDAVDDNGRSALHYAVLAAKREPLFRLLEHRARLLADKQGHTPLHVALAMQSRSMVEMLVDHGARLDRSDASNHAVLVQAIAVDSAALLTQAAENGWDPNIVFFEQWLAAQVAGFYDAGRCVAWLASRIKPGAPEGVAIVKGDTPPVAIGGQNPAELRTADEFYPADAVKVTGIVSAAGEFLFPRIIACGDERTGCAVLEVAPTWRFRPATKQGAAVPARAALVIPFPARDHRIHSLANLEVTPNATSIASANPDAFSTRSDNEVKRVTTPTFTTPFGGPAGGQISNLSELQLYPEYTTVTPTNQWAAITFVVEADGKLNAVQVVDAVSPTYAASVEDAIKRSRFTAGRAKGHPARSRVTLTFPIDGT